MNSNLVFGFVLELVLLYILAVVFYYFMLLRRKIKIEERLNQFSVYKAKKETKFFDKMDFVSKKLLLAILFLIILITINMIKYENITLLAIIIAFVTGFYSMDLFLFAFVKITNKEQENDLLKAITIMNNSFKSGHSIMQAIKLVSVELDSPLGLEFKKMYVDLTYGLSLDVVFKRFESRVKLNDVKYITTSLTILNSTGGDIVKVFESVEKTFFNNKKLKEELKSLTASSKLLYYVLLFIPVSFVLFIYILDNSYFMPLVSSTLGYLIIIICVIIYVSYIFIVRKMMKIGDNL